eukprot:Polyplicarium_translucidae@DN5339_c0_g1_i1.p1
MKEIVSIHVGQTGTGIGQAFWEHARWEEIADFGAASGTDYRQRCMEADGAIFRQAAKGKRRPRAIFVDSSPIALPQSVTSATTVPPTALCISHENGTCMSNWASGRYSAEAASLATEVRRRARLEAEACESLQGFQLTHSCSGGTGSGLGARIMEELRETYPKRARISFGVLPSLRTHFDRVTATYN